MGQLELLEREAYARQQRLAEQKSRGSAAGTSTATGHSLSGLVRAESSMVYMQTYSISGSTVTETMVLGTGLGTTGGTFGTGG